MSQTMRIGSGSVAQGGHLLRLVVKEDGLVDHLLLLGREWRGERVLAQDADGQVLPQFDMALLGSDCGAGQGQARDPKAGGDLLVGHLTPARVVQDEGDVHHAGVDGYGAVPDQLTGKGQTDGHVYVGGAHVQIREHEGEEAGVLGVHELEISRLPGDVGQVVQEVRGDGRAHG